jgi:uncharacterized damage-inducible protein DinB
MTYESKSAEMMLSFMISQGKRWSEMNVKAEYLEQVESAWNELIDVLTQCEDSYMNMPGAAGYWSPKDVMAHITWFEREMIGVLEKRALTGSDWWNYPTDDRNLRIYEANKDRPLDEIRSEFFRVHADLWALLQKITAEDLTNPTNFKDMPPNWVPIEVIAGNTSSHYREHARWMLEWLDSLKAKKS